jgi:hypothetical protein
MTEVRPRASKGKNVSNTTFCFLVDARRDLVRQHNLGHVSGIVEALRPMHKQSTMAWSASERYRKVEAICNGPVSE